MGTAITKYKETSIGIIPSDWEVKHLCDVALVDNESLTSTTRPDYEFDYISLSDVDSNFFEIETSRQIFKAAPSRARRIVKKGDILMSTVRPNLQGFSIVNSDVQDLIASTGFAVITATKCHNQFLFQYIFSNPIQKQFYNLIVGSNYPAINSSDVKQLKIPIPLINEQQKIATILTTWDTGINNCKAIIEKLKERNKTLAIQLLTGKMKVKGFKKAKWIFISMNKIFERVQVKNISDNDTYEVLTISGKQGFVSQNIKFSRVIAGNSLKNYTLLNKGEFSYNKGNSKTYQYGCVFRLDNYAQALVPNVYISFKSISEEIDTTFYSHYFKQDLLKPSLAKIISSGARMDGLLNVNAEDFFDIKIPFTSIQEQKAIANILDAAFAELNQYQQKLLTLQLQKKGLMQQLLTGKTRVKI